MSNAFRKYIEIAPVVVEGEPDAHNVFLKVTNQRFTIGPFASETKEAAEWMADMLCVALAKVATDHTADLEAQVADWKSRYESAGQALDATIEDCERHIQTGG